MVCSHDYELRNPQDFIRVRPERVAPAWARPESVDVFIETLALADIIDMSSGEGDSFLQDYVDPTYFLQDYISPRFELIVGFNRAFTENVEFTDNTFFEILSSISDTIFYSDTIGLSFVTNLIVNDSVTYGDTGYTVLTDYVESGYFADIYVGSYTTF